MKQKSLVAPFAWSGADNQLNGVTTTTNNNNTETANNNTPNGGSSSTNQLNGSSSTEIRGAQQSSIPVTTGSSPTANCMHLLIQSLVQFTRK